MMRSLNTAGTGMVAQQYNLDVIANNLANINTTAFKAQRAEFQDLIYQTLEAAGAPTGAENMSPGALQVGLGTQFAATSTNFGIGPMQATGNQLDVAIQGEGFFRITMPDGSTAFTRDGSFKLDGAGQLVTSDGYIVDPPITVEAGSRAFNISADGRVTAIPPQGQDPQELGVLQVTVFPNPSGMTRIGRNLFQPSVASGEGVATDPSTNGAGPLSQRFVEGSNVQVVEEMVRMILAQRSYEVNSKAIQTADDMLGVLNNLKR